MEEAREAVPEREVAVLLDDFTVRGQRYRGSTNETKAGDLSQGRVVMGRNPCNHRCKVVPVTDRAQELLCEALMLPIDQRADVAAELLASLDGPSTMDTKGVQAAWASQIERRARRVMAGESLGEPWEDVRARVVRRLADQ
jgi:hypothetical protein